MYPYIFSKTQKVFEILRCNLPRNSSREMQSLIFLRVVEENTMQFLLKKMPISHFTKKTIICTCLERARISQGSGYRVMLVVSGVVAMLINIDL